MLLPEQGKALFDRMREFPGLLKSSAGEDPYGYFSRDHSVRDKLEEIRRGDWKALNRRISNPDKRIEIDTVNVVALRIDFLKDSAGNESTTADGGFDLRSAAEAKVPVDPPPHNKSFFESHLEALRRYYWAQSGHSLWIEYDVFPAEEDSAYHLDDTINYGPWVVSIDNPDLLTLAERFIKDALVTADTTDADIDFSKYDSFLLFHAGPDFQGDINYDTSYDIPSFNLFTTEPIALEDSTVFVDLIMVVPETVSQDRFMGALNGVVTHEFGHQLGFHDLYNIWTFLPEVGMFSLMDSGDNTYGVLPDPYQNNELVFVRGAIPSSVDPWHKYLFFQGDAEGPGVSFRELESPGEESLDAVLASNEILLLPLNLEEWYFIENRPYDLNGDGAVILRADSLTGVILGPDRAEDSPEDTLGALEYDYLLPGGGLLIWHIDWQAINDNLRYLYGGINIFHDHRGVQVVEADGIPDLGDLYSPEWTGGPYDYWYKGGFHLFGPDTEPSTESSHGTPTFISMDILDPAGVTMRFQWENGWTRPRWPKGVGGSLGWGALVALDLDQDGGPLDILAGGDGLFALTADGFNLARVMGADGIGRWALSEGPLSGALAWNPDFVWPDGARGLLASNSLGGQLHLWDLAEKSPRFVWPDSFVAAQEPHMITGSPVILDSIVVVGGEDGRIRGFCPGLEQALLWRLEPGGGPITALGAGDLDEDGSTEIYWTTENGQIGVAHGSQNASFEIAEGWPVTPDRERGMVDLIGAVARPEYGGKGDPGGLWALDSRGRLYRWPIGADGSRVGEAGVIDFGEPPAGYLAMGDLDGDQQLELVIPLASGTIAVRALDGSPESHFPRQIWSADDDIPGPLHAPPLILPPAGDDIGLIFQPRPRGELSAIGADGRQAWGWPQTLGYEVTGALWVGDLEGDGDLEVVVGDTRGWITLLDVPRTIPDSRKGDWCTPGGNAMRTRFVDDSRIPIPEAAGDDLVSGPAKIYPNPVRSGQATLDIPLTQPAHIKLEALDAEGRKVESWEWTAAGAPDGERLPFDVTNLAPGFYLCRIQVEGASGSYSTLKKLAVVR